MTNRLVALVAALALFPLAGEAKFMQPVPAPVDRLITNIERQLTNRQGEAGLHYRRARLYALKAVQKDAHIRGNEEINFDILSRNSAVLGAEATDEVRTALQTSIESYRAALKLKPDDAAAHLGLAWALEAGAKTKTPGAELKEALAEYRKAFDLAQGADGKLTEQPLSLTGLAGLISYEAAEAYLRATSPGGEDPAFAKAAQEHLGKLKALPKKRVTPVIFSRSGKETLEELQARGRCSTFDLDGTGRGECWRWLTAKAGILVWDPSGKGEVKSGWQLFGSVSFFVFFDHGYQALEALDDDGDGWLSGKELPGLAVWTDLDGDGHPAAREVKPVQKEGIAKIAVRAVQRADGLWHQPKGLVLRDGSTRPTWDWISTAVNPQLTTGATP